MSLEELCNIRIYTDKDTDLILDTIIQVTIDNDHKFYLVTPAQFKIITSDIVLKIMFGNSRHVTTIALSYLILSTNIETVEFYICQLETNGIRIYIRDDLIDYIGDAFNAIDCRMWKYILDKTTISLPFCISAMIDAGLDDVFLDNIINACVYMKFEEKLSNNEFIADNIHNVSLVTSCINCNNYAILKYILQLCSKYNIQLDTRYNLLRSILEYRMEYVDLLLIHCDSTLMDVDDYGVVSSDLNLVPIQFMHQLYIDGRVGMTNELIVYLIELTLENNDEILHAYLVTAFPYCLDEIDQKMYDSSTYIQDVVSMNKKLINDLTGDL